MSVAGVSFELSKMGHSRSLMHKYSWAELQMTRAMIEPGREEALYADLTNAAFEDREDEDVLRSPEEARRLILKALDRELDRVSALPEYELSLATMSSIDDVWEYLLTNVCQVTRASKAHMFAILAEAREFASRSTFTEAPINLEAQWRSELLTESATPIKELKKPKLTACPQYRAGQVAKFQKCHKVYVYDKSCWSEWILTRKPDDCRGQPENPSQLYVDLTEANKLRGDKPLQAAVSAVNKELEVLHSLPTQTRTPVNFTMSEEGHEVWFWLVKQAFQVTNQQKDHLSSILHNAIACLNHGGLTGHGDEWRSTIPTLQPNSPGGIAKYEYSYGEAWNKLWADSDKDEDEDTPGTKC